jgi:hypothetical protein
MKTLLTTLAICAATGAFAQDKSPVHGTTYGSKISTVGMMDASKLDAFMGRKVSVSTTIEGKVLKVTKTKGGWFTIDAGNGNVIPAHFNVYDINIPASLAGHTVIVEGVASKQFIADASQHLAGGTGAAQKPATNPSKDKLSFAVTGLMVKK